MKLNLKKVANPYIAFAVSWFLCLFLYSLGWSELFPPITLALFLFLSGLIFVFLLTGIFFNRIAFPAPKLSARLNPTVLLIVNGALFSLNFLYSGIPLLIGTRMDNFGIPTVIVIATTLNCFTGVYCFYAFLHTRKKRYLLYILICFSFFLLSFSRGNIMMSMVTMFFLWINVKMPNLNVKRLLGIVCGVLLVAFVFGVAGNYRTINDIRQQKNNFDETYNSNVILGLGGASDSFKDSIVPGEFFWTYLYLTSPLSNLQYNINKNNPSFSISGIFCIIIDELLFDTVSKRVDGALGRERRDPDLLVEQLTVPTTLTGSYNYAGWGGMVFFMVVFWSFPIVYSLIVSRNPLGIIGISTLCTVYFFSIFDNMFILTGLTFQIFYPIVFDIIDRVKLKGTADE
jgi:hypothetical protein